MTDRYRYDLAFREQVNYAAERGIPLSVFQGRVVADDEPEWLPNDRDAALVWLTESKSKCSRCGTWDWEWDNDPNAWEADIWRCRGCEGIDVQQRRLRADTNSRHDGKQIRMFRPTEG